MHFSRLPHRKRKKENDVHPWEALLQYQLFPDSNFPTSLRQTGLASVTLYSPLANVDAVQSETRKSPV